MKYNKLFAFILGARKAPTSATITTKRSEFAQHKANNHKQQQQQLHYGQLLT